MDFNLIWQPLYRHGSSDRYKVEAAALWARLTPDQQQHIYNTITAKLAAGRWLQFDPVRAISEHIPKAKPSRAEPKNYQHRALPAGKIVVSAKYNGAWGFYTLEDAEAFGMDIRYPEYIFTTDRRIVDQINNHVDWVQVKVPYLTDDFIFCSRKNAEKYHLKILADPRNPASNAGSMDGVGTSLQDRNALGAFNLPLFLLSPRSITALALRGGPEK